MLPKTSQECSNCKHWGANAPPRKGDCPVLRRQTWGCQWCGSWEEEE